MSPGRWKRLYLTRDAARRRRLVREALAAQPGDRVLDVGCGPGFYCLEIVKEVGPDGEVVGIDAAVPMLELGQPPLRGLRQRHLQTRGRSVAPGRGRSLRPRFVRSGPRIRRARHQGASRNPPGAPTGGPRGDMGHRLGNGGLAFVRSALDRRDLGGLGSASGASVACRARWLPACATAGFEEIKPPVMSSAPSPPSTRKPTGPRSSRSSPATSPPIG